MKTRNNSIFNLIEIFRKSPKRIINTLQVKETHCEHKHIHDYYCDAERPHISTK